MTHLYPPPPDADAARVDPMTLLRDAVAGRRVLTRAEQQRVAVAIGGKNPSLRAYLTVAMMDERAGTRLSADAVRVAAIDMAAYARALAEIADGRAEAEQAVALGVAPAPLALDVLEVAPTQEATARAGGAATDAPALRPEDLEVADASPDAPDAPDATRAAPRWRSPYDVFPRTPLPLCDLSAPPRSTP